ncbi:MAG TPA: biotin/lipoate A/B protein ligase family protein, partial [Spirochaetia bacterium]|nr:biotin/lipoate A/B protein ligase family protein [Spirochaetia bacterium]
MPETKAKWRLLDSGPGVAARNMAVDEALLLEHAAGRTGPTLRFYRWDPPALSIGHFQTVQGEVNLNALQQEGFGWVRRLTGGRAVLHWADLTYSVVVGEAVLSGSVVETYRLLSAGLLAGLALLGVKAELGAPAPAGREKQAAGVQQAACFAVPSSYELLVNGKKLIGSAQVRQKNTILQHGSLLLDFDPYLLARVTGPGDRAASLSSLYKARVTSLREVLGFSPPHGELVAAMAQGFARALGISLV